MATHVLYASTFNRAWTTEGEQQRPIKSAYRRPSWLSAQVSFHGDASMAFEFRVWRLTSSTLLHSIELGQRKANNNGQSNQHIDDLHGSALRLVFMATRPWPSSLEYGDSRPLRFYIQ